MKLNIISDLHCRVKDGKVDWMRFDPEELAPADYLIVAGDSGYDPTERIIHKDLRERTKGLFRGILTIKGNHSYWGSNLDDRETDDEVMTVMPPNDTIDLVEEDVAIIGTTLWTNAISIPEIRYMNDYNYIPGFSPAVKLQRYAKESRWLRAKYEEYKGQGKKIVIVTHHNPRGSLILPEYSRDHEDVTTAYWLYKAEEDLETWESDIQNPGTFTKFFKGLIRDVSDLKPEIWVCGHIHEDLDVEHEGTRFIRHPIGYRWGWYSPDITDPECRKYMTKWYDKVVEI